MPCNLAVSTDTLVLAIASNTSIYIYSCTNGELLETLTDVHNGKTVFIYNTCISSLCVCIYI